MWKKILTTGVSAAIVTVAVAEAGILAPKSTNQRYTVNYARSSAGYPTINTIVSITSRSTKPNDISVAFFDQQGALQCLAVGSVNVGQTRMFGTTAWADEFSYSPINVDFPAFRVADSTVSPPTTTQDICDDVEGRVEIYSKYPNLQVAPWLVSSGTMTAIPMQAKKQSSKGGH
ncbi:MAG: hypothetical protein ACTFAK_12395 [Candidatus Electronema sp. VV]